MFVEAGCNGAIMLDFVKEPLDEVALFVGALVEWRRIEAVVKRPYVRSCSLRGDPGSERIAIIGPVREKHTPARQRCQHVPGALAIVSLAFGQLQRNRQPARIDERVDFGRKPAAGTAHATASAAFFSPLAAC